MTTDIEDIKNKVGIAENDKLFHEYEKIIYQLFDICKCKDSNRIIKKCRSTYQTLSRRNDIHVSKMNLLSVYKIMIDKNKIIANEILHQFLQKKPIRNLSGVAVITLLLSPYPDGQNFSCEENCYYCPNQPDMPRSYLDMEPAVQRGKQNEWDPVKQMNNRLESLFKQGHKISKLEIIVEGGTFTQFPKDYLERFFRDIYHSANIFLNGEKRKPFTISQEMQLNNDDSMCKIIGVCVETRPDKCDDNWLVFLRHLGVTKIQFGVQHTDNTILKKINRGHTFQDAEKGVIRVMDNGFKVCIHLMPDLPNSNPDKDREMFDIIFNKSKMYPDEMKIYPCATTPYTVIQKWHNDGKYVPYSDNSPEQLLDVLVYAMTICPYWCRLVRIIRDIPSTYIQGGNNVPNLRQFADERIKKEGLHSRDIRFREVGRNKTNMPFTYFTTQYSPEDYFISCETEDRTAILGFIRLRIPDVEHHNPIWSVLRNRGLIRELHVYGKVKNVFDKGNNNIREKQHRGIGQTLVKMAEDIAFHSWCKGTAVISGEGVRNYYRNKLGYRYNSTFEIKDFKLTKIDSIILGILEILGILGILGILLYLFILYGSLS